MVWFINSEAVAALIFIKPPSLYISPLFVTNAVIGVPSAVTICEAVTGSISIDIKPSP